jgi:2-C-methyl-D-erythritol 2,4-cyclodiphosphate synthase
VNAGPGTEVRVGVGYDSHRFAAGGPLLLGGVRIPFDRHLEGHSDADAVAHAVTDAVLGAAAAGDIGAMFPDTDARYQGADSLVLLRAAVARVAGLGWRVGNVDITVVAEQPRLGLHRDAMRANVAVALGVPTNRVSIKGKSNEGMGWIGRGEGIGCIATATLVRDAPGA